MKGFKAFNKDMTCRGFQFEEGQTYETDKAVICETGFHFCEAPHHVLSYYPGNSRFCEVEGDGTIVKRDDDSKVACTKIKIGAELDASRLCKIAVKGFFEWFNFGDKIKKAQESPDNNAGDCGAANAGYRGAANAGDCGAANAGYRGAANAGDCGAANAGYCGAANAGDRGAANAGYRGAANAGDCGAANAGDRGAANAGDRGAAIVQSEGTASVGKHGVAVCMGSESKAKGGLGAVLVLVHRNDDNEIVDVKAVKVDGDIIKADTFYMLVDGRIVPETDIKEGHDENPQGSF